MKFLIFIFLLLPLLAFAQNKERELKEGDLQLPVADIAEIEKQEEEIPTLQEVEMKQNRRPADKKNRKSKRNRPDQKKQ